MPGVTAREEAQCYGCTNCCQLTLLVKNAVVIGAERSSKNSKCSRIEQYIGVSVAEAKCRASVKTNSQDLSLRPVIGMV